MKALLHALCALAKNRDDEAKALADVDVGLPGTAKPLRTKRVAVCDESSADDDTVADENIVVVEEEYRQRLAKTELKAFCQDKAAHVPCQVCDVMW